MGISSFLERNLTKLSLAAESTGGAVIRIFNESPCRPTISSVLALGWILTLRMIPEGVSRMHGEPEFCIDQRD